jgi:hypothetical protein
MTFAQIASVPACMQTIPCGDAATRRTDGSEVTA